MGKIKPTLTLTSNASDFVTASEQGPLSFALNLNTTVDITCDDVHQGIVTIAGTGSEAILFDGATQGWRSGSLAGVGDAAPGYGGLVYLKNVTTTASNNDIYIGIGADNDIAADLSGADQPDDFGDDAAGDANVGVTRFMTLKKNEFAFFPWDYTTRITYDAAGATVLEWWIFDR